ncbi:hypothetical protein [Fructilactobacillus carniphilus]|uniref:Uncharacterized protein n=1 Tax=Fructilactobacillus carniphilus TaxID=2940297 RepID=A0ABY5BW01_9LACO|nr:hypothetical protein [Fructilactobacillus carniphilus]USS90015.1 hypothetical protein M3M37_03935 [Fructilactobacillus carniphilus]
MVDWLVEAEILVLLLNESAIESEIEVEVLLEAGASEADLEAEAVKELASESEYEAIIDFLFEASKGLSQEGSSSFWLDDLETLKETELYPLKEILLSIID